jgi:hypothetical protein
MIALAKEALTTYHDRMADNLFDTVYIAYPRKCALVRRRMKSDLAVKECAFTSAEQAWAHWIDGYAHAAGLPRPDPADFIIVSGAFTDDVNQHGAHLVLLDWQHTYDPQGFHDEVERERQLHDAGTGAA